MLLLLYISLGILLVPISSLCIFSLSVLISHALNSCCYMRMRIRLVSHCCSALWSHIMDRRGLPTRVSRSKYSLNFELMGLMHRHSASPLFFFSCNYQSIHLSRNNTTITVKQITAQCRKRMHPLYSSSTKQLAYE